MGRREKWFGAVKKVFSPESKRQKAGRSKDRWGFGKSKQPDSSPSELLDSGAAAPSEEVKLTEADREQSKEPYTVATMAAAAAATEAVPTADPNAAKVADLATSSKVSGRSRDEAAAIKIQTAFRGYLARRALRALRGLVRLKSLIHENSVKRQATTTLRCMQTLARVQSQIRSRRIRMSEENQALQRQLLLKRERELENLRMGEEWDDSLQSKEQIEAGLLSKQEAATRRERALAYAFSHQWKNSSGSAKPLFMDPTNPHWGWSWLERWMAAKPWESKSTTDRDLNNDCASVKSTTRSVGAEITNAYARRDTNSDRPSPPSQKSGRPPNRHSPSTPQSNAPSAAGRAVKSASPRSSWAPPEDDTRSITSVQSERHRRHSLAGSSVRDDESLASSPAVPSYMVATKSARAKSRFQNVSIDQTDTASDKGSVGSVKKRLSFPVGEQHGAASPAGVRRHSGPPKVSIASVKDVAVSVEL